MEIEESRVSPPIEEEEEKKPSIEEEILGKNEEQPYPNNANLVQAKLSIMSNEVSKGIQNLPDILKYGLEVMKSIPFTGDKEKDETSKHMVSHVVTNMYALISHYKNYKGMMVYAKSVKKTLEGNFSQIKKIGIGSEDIQNYVMSMNSSIDDSVTKFDQIKKVNKIYKQ